MRRWNENTAQGHDPDFGRGTSAIDKWWGDPQFGETPAATLGPLDAAPFYAVRVFSGCLGTKGGPRTNVRCEVLRPDGSVIAGLYCAGIGMAHPIGTKAVGAGTTIGPCLTFGYIAGKAIVRRNM